MATITEDYVSFEVAKLLKEKRFEGECSRFYMPSGHGRWKYEHYHDFDIRERIDCPTLQMAMKWLREVHMIDIVITPSMFRRKYNVCIYKDENLCCVDFDGVTLSPSYEYACEASIKYCLEHLM